MTFIKFGGSLITDKSQEEKIVFSAIDDLVSQIKTAVPKIGNSLLIGTGAGSFGHIQVEKYHIKGKIVSDEQKLGFAKVEDAVSRLNEMVVASFLRHKIPAVSVKPSSMFAATDHKITSTFTESLFGFIDIGILPIVYGDMIFDKTYGGMVLSTDLQFLELSKLFLSKNFLIDKIVFCGATDGVIDNAGKTIPLINSKNFSEIKNVFFDNPYVDVTGAMKKKVETALEIAKLGIKSHIINGRQLHDCLLGKDFTGTKVE